MICKRCGKEKNHPLDIENIQLIGKCMRCESIQDEIDHDKYWEGREEPEESEELEEDDDL